MGFSVKQQQDKTNNNNTRQFEHEPQMRATHVGRARRPSKWCIAGKSTVVPRSDGRHVKEKKARRKRAEKEQALEKKRKKVTGPRFWGDNGWITGLEP